MFSKSNETIPLPFGVGIVAKSHIANVGSMWVENTYNPVLSCVSVGHSSDRGWVLA